MRFAQLKFCKACLLGTIHAQSVSGKSFLIDFLLISNSASLDDLFRANVSMLTRFQRGLSGNWLQTIAESLPKSKPHIGQRLMGTHSGTAIKIQFGDTTFSTSFIRKRLRRKELKDTITHTLSCDGEPRRGLRISPPISSPNLWRQNIFAYAQLLNDSRALDLSRTKH